MRALSASDTAMALLSGSVVRSLPRLTSVLTGPATNGTATKRVAHTEVTGP